MKLTTSDQADHHSIFEEIRRQDADGIEFWSARDIAKILEYTEYRYFLPVIERAKRSCENSGQITEEHFISMTDFVELGKGGKREVESFKLSRYACYLIIQNADPSKEVVALGQTYFAVQTRKQELFEHASEDEKRYMLREELKNHNTALADAAYESGVVTPLEFAVFQNHGYKGLYGGLDKSGIHERKELKKSQKILDHMGTTELAANLFRATQTEDKLRRDGISGRTAANQTHFEVGKKVRQTIADLGGTMPEDLPTYESIKKVEKRLKKKQTDSTIK
ncbi:DNA damage-inducible protein D [Paenibacillus polymyxa]|uniref:DNA damage-inducible protein D n=1 Tax=Paenibacillus polymyxa TaxID=1406 RepID=UPI001ABADA25|nr:DNA damage-inducible protein D [Paenibacillus polymyxa]MBO3284737.1 DNA damage-inducible protein D [Paenibacillus polymyxa]